MAWFKWTSQPEKKSHIVEVHKGLESLFEPYHLNPIPSYASKPKLNYLIFPLPQGSVTNIPKLALERSSN